MYATCLFCNAGLGHNEAVEAFPVGRRLAFDAAKGRLWVVCPRCERWNLTPLEERWEAIEACERLFRDTRLRVATDEIGLARLREGTELIRIGAPQRPEMAAWRYGDQFGRRRRRSLLVGGGIAAVIGVGVVAGPLVVGMSSISAINLYSFANAVYQSRKVAARIPVAGQEAIVVHADLTAKAVLRWSDDDGRWSIDVEHRVRTGTRSFRLNDRNAHTRFTGDEALAAARLLLPAVNASGARQATVRDAVDQLERARDTDALFAHAAREHATGERWYQRNIGEGPAPAAAGLSKLPAAVRLALEMSAHEDVERRALEGELHLLESAWRDAEEIAAIADDLLLPPEVDDAMRRLKGTTG